MKKKILIVNKSFDVGGIQTSLINMLKDIKDDYDIDLLVFYDHGKFKDKVPKEINIINPSLFVMALGMAMTDLKKCKNPILIVFRIFATLWTKLFSNSLPVSLALMTQKKLRGYDLAIAFHHETGKNTVVSGFSRFIINCVEAKKKVSWVHADSIKAGLNTERIGRIYNKLDRIVCVSKSAMESFISCFPELKYKCDYCYNFNPYNEIIEKSKEFNNLIDRNIGEIVLFTACRFSKEKGLPRAIKSIAKLIGEGYKIKWYIAGDGAEEVKILQYIKKYSLEDNIFLLGVKTNPYPYMREADMLFTCSYHEAAPMVVDEAKIVGVPIFSTDIPVIREKVNNEIGFICENSEEGIYRGLKEILDNPMKLKSSREFLSKQSYTNDESIKFFNNLVLK